MGGPSIRWCVGASVALHARRSSASRKQSHPCIWWRPVGFLCTRYNLGSVNLDIAHVVRSTPYAAGLPGNHTTVVSLALPTATAVCSHCPSPTSSVDSLSMQQSFALVSLAHSTALSDLAAGTAITISPTDVVDGLRCMGNGNNDASYHLYRWLRCCKYFGCSSAWFVAYSDSSR